MRSSTCVVQLSARVFDLVVQGQSLLYLSASLGDDAVTSVLLEGRADPNELVLANEFPSVLHLATKAGNAQLVESLLAARAEQLSAPANSFKEPLHIAAEYGHLNVLTLLLSRANAQVDGNDNAVEVV